MNIDKIGTEGHAVQSWQLTGEQAAFQPSVDGLDFRLLAGLRAVDLDQLLAKRGLAAVFPRADTRP